MNLAIRQKILDHSLGLILYLLYDYRIVLCHDLNQMIPDVNSSVFRPDYDVIRTARLR